MKSKTSLEANRKYRKTPKGKYNHQKISAKERGIDWLISFEEWWNIWESSGKWDERGRLGYHMCRYGDNGPYSKDNVYISHHIQNKKDQWRNGHTSFPPNRWLKNV